MKQRLSEDEVAGAGVLAHVPCAVARSEPWAVIPYHLQSSEARSLEEAALFEAPFEYVKKHVKPLREKNHRAQRRRFWWRHGETGTGLHAATEGKRRKLASPIVSKHRLFVWLPPETAANQAVVIFARDDDYFLGVLHSRVHEVWARGTGTQLREAESGFRYTPTTCFETFPFPQPTPEQKEAIAAAAKELNRLHEAWLNPAPADGVELSKAELKKRTLTNLYNQRPTWLVNAHAALDAAVFAAYGWSDQLSDSEILARLLELNLQREPA